MAKETAREGSEHPQVRGAKEEGARVYASESTQAQALRPKSRPPGAAAEGPWETLMEQSLEGGTVGIRRGTATSAKGKWGGEGSGKVGSRKSPGL